MELLDLLLDDGLVVVVVMVVDLVAVDQEQETQIQEEGVLQDLQVDRVLY
jgi:hypothetical protein